MTWEWFFSTGNRPNTNLSQSWAWMKHSHGPGDLELYTPGKFKMCPKKGTIAIGKIYTWTNQWFSGVMLVFRGGKPSIWISHPEMVVKIPRAELNQNLRGHCRNLLVQLCPDICLWEVLGEVMGWWDPNDFWWWFIIFRLGGSSQLVSG